MCYTKDIKKVTAALHIASQFKNDAFCLTGVKPLGSKIKKFAPILEVFIFILSNSLSVLPLVRSKPVNLLLFKAVYLHSPSKSY